MRNSNDLQKEQISKNLNNQWVDIVACAWNGHTLRVREKNKMPIKLYENGQLTKLHIRITHEINSNWNLCFLFDQKVSCKWSKTEKVIWVYALMWFSATA